MTSNKFSKIQKKYYTSLDLEMNQPSGKIIQIGAVVGDVTTGQIVESLSVHINPEEKLAERITNLTGITQKEVEAGLTLVEGYRPLREMHLAHDCFMNPITWGGGDSEYLSAQLRQDTKRRGQTSLWCFGRRWIDIKTVYQLYRLSQGLKPQSGLAKSMGRLGLRFEGKKHNARDDAYNTFRVFCSLLNKFKPYEGNEK